ncbi:hypothetical protein [Modestobacter sp. VKM Ac-2985]|uniref:hypothetical protein n=1 Tax=Modestobacter sp. VKM Ac-2985 TaxID=3004139 RepID=UPI0022AB8184|nr:hypothetical protein [Modestobacter sp. VKM Ac-2985]MCZ2839917.1 hypothetical protein [Modestobacter sp. VKM Ac-2985]
MSAEPTESERQQAIGLYAAIMDATTSQDAHEILARALADQRTRYDATPATPPAPDEAETDHASGRIRAARRLCGWGSGHTWQPYTDSAGRNRVMCQNCGEERGARAR